MKCIINDVYNNDAIIIVSYLDLYALGKKNISFGQMKAK